MNGVIFTLNDNSDMANSPTGCATRVAYDIRVPKELLPDTYIFRQTMLYKVNPLRTITVVFESNKFKVVE